MPFNLVSEHLQSPQFQFRTLAVTSVSVQNTCSHLWFRSEHLQSPLFQTLFQNTCSRLCFRPCFRTLAVTFVSDLVSEHLQSPLFQILLPSFRFILAPGSLYARHNIDSYSLIFSVCMRACVRVCACVRVYVCVRERDRERQR